MAMSSADRFKLKSQLYDEIKEWEFDRINLLFGEFGLELLADGWNGPGVPDIIASVPDGPLVEMYGVVKGLDASEVADVVETAPDEGGNWMPGYVRLFISHSSQHKVFLGEVARELAVVGVHGFVAHDTMAFSRPWQTQIEHALRSMQAFVYFAHPEAIAAPGAVRRSGGRSAGVSRCTPCAWVSTQSGFLLVSSGQVPRTARRNKSRPS